MSKNHHQQSAATDAKETTTGNIPDRNKTQEKKTRDLPNLSECQSCGFRIDVCSGKKGLQPLTSEWRIVLLCRNCFVLVNSSQICSYCFKEPSNSDPCFLCPQCKRVIHQRCFLNYANVAPWSYSCSGCSNFSVCIDCWIPKSLANRRKGGVFTRNVRRKKFLESRSSKSSEDGKCGLEDQAKEANCVMEDKVEGAEKAGDLGVSKEKEINVGGMVNKVCDNKVVDDAQLAFQLHRAMNSSPRILKGVCVVNSSSLTDRRIHECNGGRKIRAYERRNSSRSRKLEESCAGVSRNLFGDSPADSLSGKRIDNESIRLSAKDDSSDARPKDEEGSCSNKVMNSSVDGDCLNSELQTCRVGVELVTPIDERCQTKHDRYLMKYSRRKLNESSNCDSRPPASFYECLLLRTHASPIGTMLSCSNESISFSNSSRQSCTLASICSSGISRDQS